MPRTCMFTGLATDDPQAPQVNRPDAPHDGSDGYPCLKRFTEKMEQHLQSNNVRVVLVSTLRPLLSSWRKFRTCYPTIQTADELQDVHRLISNPAELKAYPEQSYRKWIQKHFVLRRTAAGTVVAHRTKGQLVAKEHLYATLLAAHAREPHGGRDKTTKEIQRANRWVLKGLVELFVKLCPTCHARNEAATRNRALTIAANAEVGASRGGSGGRVGRGPAVLGQAGRGTRGHDRSMSDAAVSGPWAAAGALSYMQPPCRIYSEGIDTSGHAAGMPSIRFHRPSDGETEEELPAREERRSHSPMCGSGESQAMAPVDSSSTSNLGDTAFHDPCLAFGTSVDGPALQQQPSFSFSSSEDELSYDSFMSIGDPAYLHYDPSAQFPATTPNSEVGLNIGMGTPIISSPDAETFAALLKQIKVPVVGSSSHSYTSVAMSYTPSLASNTSSQPSSACSVLPPPPYGGQGFESIFDASLHLSSAPEVGETAAAALIPTPGAEWAQGIDYGMVGQGPTKGGGPASIHPGGVEFSSLSAAAPGDFDSSLWMNV